MIFCVSNSGSISTTAPVVSSLSNTRTSTDPEKSALARLQEPRQPEIFIEMVGLDVEEVSKDYKLFVTSISKKSYVTSISKGFLHKTYLIDINSIHPRMSAPPLEKEEGQNINYYTNREADQQRALLTQNTMSPLQVNTRFT
jgi:hypothetical protein